MENIHNIVDDFDFEKLKISSPISKPGGYYLLKFTKNGSPLYIQPHKCITKSGIVTGKKTYTDLLFSNDNQEFLTWLEQLETQCHNYIYENREKWFEGKLEFEDIESYFVPPTKFYKSGKFYLVRVNIPTIIGKPALKIYDESENEVNISEIKDMDTEINTVLEFKGIRCSARSFQIDIEVKQIMKMEPVQLFSKCIFKTNKKPATTPVPIEIESETTESTDDELPIIEKENIVIEESLSKDDNSVQLNNLEENISIVEDDNEKKDEGTEELVKSAEKEENNENDLGNIEEKEEKEEIIIDTNNDSIQEIDLDSSILDSTDVVEIKEANEVYYKMYKEAIKRAKIARDLALSSYLEAKNIKNKYMLDEALLESDDDSDLEKELEEE